MFHNSAHKPYSRGVDARQARIGDNTERKGRGYTDQGGTEGGGGSATIPRRRAEAIHIKEAQRGGRPATIQRGKAGAIQITGAAQGGRIGDNTKGKSRGSTDQRCAEGGESATIQRVEA